MPGASLLRRLNSFDATLIVMGGIIGSGIFMTPATVAQRARAEPMILGAWVFGGLLALIGGYIFAELAWRGPATGGLYAYMRDAFHPVVAFMYGWTALLVSQSGGMAAAAVTFASYFNPLSHIHASGTLVAVLMLIVFSIINCFGVREGGSTQNAFMLVKIVAIAAIVVAGLLFAPAATGPTSLAGAQATFAPLVIFGAALIPVLFAYDGWQTAAVMGAELKRPERSLALGMVVGVVAVIVLYLGMSVATLRVLGLHGLMSTATPASDVARAAAGPVGERVVAAIIGLSTLGFLSNQILVSPRIYHAMAHDGLFFKQVAWIHPKSHVPIVAIALQGVVAIVITLSGRYDQILNYVTSIDYVFFALAAGAIFVFRARARQVSVGGISVPAHPWSTTFFLLASVLVVVNTLVVYPKETIIGLLILISAVPIYLAWKRFAPR